MKSDDRLDKYLDRFSFITSVIDVILAGITLIDVFYFVAYTIEKIWHRKQKR